MPVIRCRNEEAHERVSGIGNIILLFDKDCIYVKCGWEECKARWKIKISIPGVNLNLNEAAFIQERIDKFPKLEIDESSPVFNKNINRNMYGVKKMPVIIKEKSDE
jgi:hypothetical protein